VGNTLSPQSDSSPNGKLPDAPIAIVRRGPRIAHSALFGTLFMAAIFLTILGALLSYSADENRIDQAWDILRFNLIIILILAVYLGHRVWTTVFTASHGQAAPLLHRRFVMIFSLAALIPAVLVGGFSISLLSQNLSGIFGDRVRANMEEARQILDGYVAQEFENLGEDVDELKQGIARSRTDFSARISFTAELWREAQTRDLDAVYILREDGFVLSRVEAPDAPDIRIPGPEALEGLKGRNIAFQKRTDIDYLIALTQLSESPRSYLYVGKLLRSDNQVLSSISGIESAASQIARFNESQARMNQIFFFTLLDSALLILMAAIWLGLSLANRIIDPLSGLVNAAERVRAGDMGARVSVSGEWGEISDLGSAFNRMTSQLESQRDELIREHDVSEQRRQFSEAVLSGVRAGVIGLTQQGKITLTNDAAKTLLEDRAQTLVGQPLSNVLEEFAPTFAKARESISSNAEDQVTVEMGGGSRIFDLHVSAYKGARNDTGWVLTFDDMTRLVSAQRHSAWREVARRIAHEIKNPLTPIQLSAERLARKYTHEIKSDRKTFENCTQTIIRQVGSLEQMVDEFSAFARMPSPELVETDLDAILQDAIFAQGVSFPEIRFFKAGSWPSQTYVRGDERLLGQALTNVLKNAGEAVQSKMEAGVPGHFKGEVKIELIDTGSRWAIHVTDNGPGWPFKDTDRLMEPYVTTRETGTGLGLAIVKRIIEDHGGQLKLESREDAEGARTLIYLPQSSDFTPTADENLSEVI
jgi:two-component system nitrogen regulation sensor histidine kinase NtrY